MLQDSSRASQQRGVLERGTSVYSDLKDYARSPKDASGFSSLSWEINYPPRPPGLRACRVQTLNNLYKLSINPLSPSSWEGAHPLIAPTHPPCSGNPLCLDASDQLINYWGRIT